MSERAIKNAQIMLTGIHDHYLMELERWNEVGNDLIKECTNPQTMFTVVSHLIQSAESLRMAREELILRGQLSS